MLLVEKGETKTAPVFRVEPGRWGGSGQFIEHLSAASNLTQSGLSATLRDADSGDQSGQAEIWWRVESNLRGVTAESGRATFAGVEASGSVDAARQRYGSRFAQLAVSRPDAVGVLLAAGDQIPGAEIFADHPRLAAQWPSLLDAAVVDALQVVETTHPMSRKSLNPFSRPRPTPT